MKTRTRKLVWQRAHSLCEYCQLPASYSEFGFEIDHVIAEKHGGDSSLDNLCLACFCCNSYNGPNLSGVDPNSGQIVPIYNPRRQEWRRHFEWNGPLLVGKSRAGRATIDIDDICKQLRISRSTYYRYVAM